MKKTKLFTKREFNNFFNKYKLVITVIFLVISLMVYISLLRSQITGFSVHDKYVDTTLNLNKNFSNNITFTFNKNKLNSLKLTGNVTIFSPNATVKILLETDDKNYTIYSLDKKLIKNNKKFNKITGFVITNSSNKSIKNKTSFTNISNNSSVNRFFNNFETSNFSNDSNLTNTSKSKISNNVSLNQTNKTTHNSKLKINNSLINLSNTTNLSSSNISNVSIKNITFSDDVKNNTNKTEIDSINSTQTFNLINFCEDTCSLNNTNSKNVHIIVEDANLHITNIFYTKKVKNVPPEQIKNFTNEYITLNSSLKFNLTNYFTDNNNDTLFFDHKEVKDLNIKINNEILIIKPKKIGTYNFYVYVNDGDSLIQSNYFLINVLKNNIDFKINNPETINKTNESSKLSGSSKEYSPTDEIISPVKINSPVRLVKHIKLNQSKRDVVVKLHKNASKIKVNKVVNNFKEDISDKLKTEKQNKKEPNNLITGNVVSEEKELNISNEDTKEVIIEDEIEEAEIEYELPGPVAEEKIMSNHKKQIIVSSDIHYENILAFSFINNTRKENINLFHLINGSKVKVDFDAYDLDNDTNNLVDYVEWVVPHLSNQTYELEIDVLNVFTYVEEGDNWTVMFNTTGVANLNVTPFNDSLSPNITRWSDYSDNASLFDLKFLEVKCGDEIFNYSWLNETDSVFVENYSCNNNTGFLTSKKLAPTEAWVALNFSFSGQNETVSSKAYDAACVYADDCDKGGICIGGVCRASCLSGDMGVQCSDDTTNPYYGDGICTWSEGSNDYICDETSASNRESSYYDGCYSAPDTDSISCDSNSLAGGFSATGACVNASLLTSSCCTDYLSSNSGVSYNDLCGTESSVCSGNDGAVCDDVSDGSFDSGYVCSSSSCIEAKPIIQTSRISPVNVFNFNNLLGYCNATDPDSSTVNYYYRWYKNGILNSSGFNDNSGSGFTQGVEVNVANLSSSLTSLDDNWTFSCLASDGNYNSSWSNSSVIVSDLILNLSINLSPDSINENSDSLIDVYGSVKDQFDTPIINQDINIAFDGSEIYFSDWWNSTWNYKKQLNITNTNNTESLPKYYVINISVDTESLVSQNKLLANGSDLRIIYYTGNDYEQIDRINTTGFNTSSTTIKFSLQKNILPGASDTNYYLYYGGESSNLKNDENNIFNIYEDFENSNLNSDWKTVDADNYATGTDFGIVNGNAYIIGAGADTWHSDDEYAGIYQNFVGDFNVTTKLNYQENTNNWAKAGIMIRNNMSAAGSSKGYCFMVSTPSNGYSWQRDESNNGYLETSNQDGSTSYPSYFKIIKEGTYFTGFYSFDGSSWNSLGISEISSTNILQSVGLAMTSHDSGSLGNVTFEYFNISLSKEDISNNPIEPSISLFDESTNILTTDSSGNYNYTVSINEVPGIYPFKLNVTYEGTTNSTTENLTVIDILEPPIVNSSIILPQENIYTNNTLVGYCNATDPDSSTVNYYYRWHKEGILNSSGFNDNSGSGFTQGVEVNVANLSSSLTSLDDNWTFSCLANDGNSNSSWLNSSIANVAYSVFECDSCSDCNDKLQNLANSNDIVLLNASLNNIDGNCITFDSVNDVTFDCQGNSIIGDGDTTGAALTFLSSSNNVIVENCILSDFNVGLDVDIQDSSFTNITSYDNVRGAFFDTDSKRNTITDSNFSYNSDNGFRLKDHCDDNVFYNNSFLFNGLYDFFIGYSSSDGNIIYNNTFRNKYFIRTESIDLNFWNSSGVGNRWLGFDSEAEGCFDSNSDGFCDSSYSFGDVVDYFPIFTNSSPSVYECGSCSACNDVLQNYDLVPGDVVKLNTSLSNIDGTCIDFGDNFKNIIFDCDNKVISGDNDSSGSGIYVPDLADYSTIRNCELNDFNVGVYAISEYSVYENITATNNSYSGFYSYHSSFCNFTNLNSSYNAVGFRFRDHSDQNIITNSTFLFNDEYDYYLGYASSDKNIFYNNTLRGEHYLNAQEDLNFWNYSGVGNRWLGFDSEAEGCFDSNSDGFCDSSYSFGDVVDYFPIFTNSSPSVYECGSCSACNDVLQNYDLVPGDVVKLNTSLSNIDGNCINFDTYNRDVIFDCDNNIISGDSDTNGAGIYIDSTDYNHHNTIQNCEFKEFHSGIQTNNNYNNFYNISSHDNSYAGIYLHYGNYNVFDNVILVNNSNGLRFYDFCKYNNITNSFSTNNTNFDFSDRYSGGDNNFYDNVFSSKDYIDTSVDHNWNSSSTGNRWLGYDDKQEGCFDSNSDGFCDSSYTIDASNIDYYPKFYSSIPSILTSNILPDPANSTQELKGYCAATDSHNDNLSYYYRWYKDGILNSSGFNDNSGSGFTQGLEVNVANLSISLTSPLDNWTFSCLGTDNYDNSSWLNHSTIITNHLPTISSVDITPQEPSLEDNLTCSVSGWSDADNDQENYYFQWYKNNSLQFTDYQSETTNVLDSDLTSLNENWTCKVTPNDGYENGSSLNDSVYVRNFPPNKPILLLPENENYSLETRTPNFIWNATDLENDTLTFELKINNSVCSDYLYDSFTPNNSSNTFNYTIPDELCTEFEASNSVYTWQVRSHDGISYSEWSDTYNFSIDDLLLIDMVDDTMNFNSLNPYDEVDSDTNNDPFVIKNVGLVEADLTNLSIASNFWQTANLGTEHLQFKADNYSTQSVFNYSESITDWTNFSSSNLNVIKALDYTENNNYAEIDLKLIVPGIESVGERQKVINFNWDITNS